MTKERKKKLENKLNDRFWRAKSVWCNWKCHHIFASKIWFSFPQKLSFKLSWKKWSRERRGEIDSSIECWFCNLGFVDGSNGKASLPFTSSSAHHSFPLSPSFKPATTTHSVTNPSEDPAASQLPISLNQLQPWKQHQRLLQNWTNSIFDSILLWRQHNPAAYYWQQWVSSTASWFLSRLFLCHSCWLTKLESAFIGFSWFMGANACKYWAFVFTGDSQCKHKLLKWYSSSPTFISEEPSDSHTWP